MPRQNERRDRGAVLLIALAILALLSLFATAFVRLVNFEKRASANYTDAVRARLLAKAGIEHAAVMVRDLADKRHYSKPGDRWEFGFDVDPGVLAGLEMHPDLQTTSAPSFPLDYAKQIKPRGDFTFLGRDLVVSGVVGETYSNGLDVYKLKVIDTASQLNLNHPTPRRRPGCSPTSCSRRRRSRTRAATWRAAGRSPSVRPGRSRTT